MNGDIISLDFNRFAVKLLDAQGEDNLLTANQASVETDTTGFTVTPPAGAVLTQDATQFRFGANSLKVASDNSTAAEGFFTDNTTVTVSLKYTASVWVKGDSGGETIRLKLDERTAADAEVGTTQSGVITLTTDWQRVEISRVFGATGARARVYVVTDTQQIAVFYVDGLQLEQSNVATDFQTPGVFHSPWVEIPAGMVFRTFWSSDLEEGATDAVIDIMVSNAETKPAYETDGYILSSFTAPSVGTSDTDSFRWVKVKKTSGTTPIPTTVILEAGRG